MAEPAQLITQVPGVGRAHDGPERLQRAAQPAGGDAHLVYRVGLVAPDHRVEGHQLGRLLLDVGHDHVGRGAAAPGALLTVAGRQLAGQGTLQLGRAASGAQAATAQPLIRGAQQMPVAAGQLDLHLPPAGEGGGVAERLRGHLVRDDLGERRPGRIDQGPGPAHGRDPRDGRERLAPGVYADQAGQFVRDGPAAAAQRRPYLPAGLRPGRQLEVPARVLAAAASPQRDARAQQPQVRGVVVLGLELDLVGGRLARHSREVFQRWQHGLRAGLVLHFNFTGVRNHGVILPGRAR